MVSESRSWRLYLTEPWFCLLNWSLSTYYLGGVGMGGSSDN